MIQYALQCEAGHKFDAWFKNADAFDDQSARGILTCPVCNSQKVEKALMAPAVATKKDAVALSAGHPEHAKFIEAMRELKSKMTANADYVGDKFAEEARKIHYEEAEARGIYGEATREDVAALAEEGIPFMPLPSLPDDHN